MRFFVFNIITLRYQIFWPAWASGQQQKQYESLLQQQHNTYVLHGQTTPVRFSRVFVFFSLFDDASDGERKRNRNNNNIIRSEILTHKLVKDQPTICERAAVIVSFGRDDDVPRMIIITREKLSGLITAAAREQQQYNPNEIIIIIITMPVGARFAFRPGSNGRSLIFFKLYVFRLLCIRI